jgi:hypothetical protein
MAKLTPDTIRGISTISFRHWEFVQPSSHHIALLRVRNTYASSSLLIRANCTVLHVGQAIFYRTWFMIPTAGFAGILEILGWSGRLWSSRNVHLKTPFMIQFVILTLLYIAYPTSFEFRITGCIIGPTPLLAADFVIFGIIIERLGAGYSRLAPKWCTFSLLHYTNTFTHDNTQIQLFSVHVYAPPHLSV